VTHSRNTRLLASLLLNVCLGYAWAAGATDFRLTTPDALHLLERVVPGASALEATESNLKGRAGFRVAGKIGSDQYEAEIDAEVPRVISVLKNGVRHYEWLGVFAVGHRGTIRFAPENTISAFKKAIELGAHVVEMDVRETKDGHFVIMHDATVFRTTGAKGVVSELTLNEIKQLDAGANFGPEFAREHVPTLEEVLDAIAGKALPDIDLKAGDIPKLVGLLRERGLLEQVTVASGNARFLQKVADLSGGKAIIRPALPEEPDPVVALQKGLDPPLVNIDDLSRFQEIHLHGMKVFTNAMSERGDEEQRIKTAIAAGADYIQTDRLDILVPLLKEQGLYAPQPQP